VSEMPRKGTRFEEEKKMTISTSVWFASKPIFKLGSTCKFADAAD